MNPVMIFMVQVLAALKRHGLGAMVIGALGVELYGTRSGLAMNTEDADLLVPPHPEALGKTLRQLVADGCSLGAGDEPLVVLDDDSIQGLVRHRATIRVERGGHLVDLVLMAQGLDFEELWPRSTTCVLEGATVQIAPLVDIVRSKLLAGRLKDHVFFATCASSWCR